MGKHTAPEEEAKCPKCGLMGGNHDLRKHRLGLNADELAEVDKAMSRHPAGRRRPKS